MSKTEIRKLPQKNSSRFQNCEMVWPVASGIQYLGNVVGRPQWYAKQDNAARRARLGTVSQLSEVFVKGQQNAPFIFSKKHDIFIANTGRAFGDGQNIMSLSA